MYICESIEIEEYEVAGDSACKMTTKGRIKAINEYLSLKPSTWRLISVCDRRHMVYFYWLIPD